VRRLLKRIPRLARDRCWCGGELLPFRWHEAYGRCAQCGSCVNRRPIRDLATLYGSPLYWHLVQEHAAVETRADLYRKDGRLQRWLDLVERFGHEKQRVIEVGCAPGVLLAELNARGYHCLGVEPDEATVQWIRKTFSVEVVRGLFPDVPLPACELFLALDVLEHSPDPEAFMRRVSELLQPAGVAIVQCPIDRYGLDPPMGEETELAFNEAEHLFIFTDAAMRELGRRAGLDVVTLDEKPWHMRHELCIYSKPGGPGRSRPQTQDTDAADPARGEEVSVRLLGPADRAELERFFRANNRPAVTAQFHPFPLTDERAEFITCAPHRDEYCGAFSREGRIVGMVMLRGWDEGYEVPSLGVVVGVAHQGRGIGRRLCAWAIGRAREKGCRRVRLTVQPGNARALGLYRSLGFREASREPATEPGGERLVMMKDL
jgi:ribosomal protein S18 acetylase RimI-like enzyme